MAEAMLEATKAAAIAEVPIGAILVDIASGEIVARAHNQTITRADPTAHAEILVIRDRCQQLGVQRIPEHDLYVTLEPCPMCAAAISYARIRKIVYGASDPKSGGLGQGPCLYDHSQLHHKPEVAHGLQADAARDMLQAFFKERRNKPA